jgi:hypothetical protein
MNKREVRKWLGYPLGAWAAMFLSPVVGIAIGYFAFYTSVDPGPKRIGFFIWSAFWLVWPLFAVIRLLVDRRRERRDE